MEIREQARVCASIAVWLDRHEVQELFKLVVAGAGDGANRLLREIYGELPGGVDLREDAWAERFLDELAYRLSPADHTDDQEDVETQEVPDLGLFAPDFRTGEVERPATPV